jgi:hypothetical protein
MRTRGACPPAAGAAVASGTLESRTGSVPPAASAHAAHPPLAGWRHLPHVLLATTVVAVAPTVLVWWLRASGTLTSYPIGAALGLAGSLTAAWAGRALWQTRPGSRDILFGELMAWGFALRCYRERRLRSARAVLGTTCEAQLRMPDGLSRERQVRLLEGLARMLDARDPGTHGHSRRVARYSWMLAGRMGLAREEIDRVRCAAAVHDVGKIDTPDAILRNPAALSNAEYEIIKRHAADGARMVAALNDPALTAIVRHHHERLDGSGYPDGLRGEEIPLGARIVAVADTFDAITSDRAYRAARTHKEALAVLRREAGTRLDADAVRAFCDHYSGHRSIALWSSLTTVPSRLASMLGSGVSGLATAARAAVVAAALGNAAASATTLVTTHPAGRSHRGSTAASAGAPASAHAVPARGGAATASNGARRGAHPGATTTLTGTGSDGHRPAAGAAAGPVPSQLTAGSTTGPSGDGSASPAPSTGASGGGHGAHREEGGGGSREHTGEQGGGEPRAHTPPAVPPTPGEHARGKSEEGKGKPEGAKGKPEEGKGKPEEAKGKAEEGKGKPEEAKGKGEEVKAKGEEAKAKVEGTTGKGAEAAGHS